MDGEGAVTRRFRTGGRSRVARAIDDAEELSRRIVARAARARETPVGAPQCWAAVRAARSGVIGGVRERSAAMPYMSCRGGRM